MESALKHDPDMLNALSSLLELAGLPNSDAPTAQTVQEAVNKLKGILSSQNSSSSDSALLSNPSNSLFRDAQNQKVLIAGQLGIVLHQLKQALAKQGAEVTLAKDMESAIEECQKSRFGLAIIDLYMPSEREGLIVMNEIKRSAGATPTEIIVLSPPCRDQNLQETCLNQGAKHFLEKVDGWHNTILSIYAGEWSPEPSSRSGM